MDRIGISGKDLLCLPVGISVIYGGREYTVADRSETGAELHPPGYFSERVILDEADANGIVLVGDGRVVRQNVALLEGHTRMLSKDIKAFRGGNVMEFLSDDDGYMFPITPSTERNYGTGIRPSMVFAVAGGAAGSSPIAFAAPELIEDVPNAIVAVSCEVSPDYSNAAMHNIGTSAYKFNLMLREDFESGKAGKQTFSVPQERGLLSWLRNW